MDAVSMDQNSINMGVLGGSRSRKSDTRRKTFIGTFLALNFGTHFQR